MYIYIYIYHYAILTHSLRQMKRYSNGTQQLRAQSRLQEIALFYHITKLLIFLSRETNLRSISIKLITEISSFIN